MQAPPKTPQIRAFGSCARGGLALGAAVGVLALLTFGVPKSAVWDRSPAPKPQDWAGHLESPAEHAAATPEPLTSASYTTGFDKAAVAPLSPIREPQQSVRDPNVCPSDLNCAFRTAQGAPRPPVAPSPIAPPPIAPVAAPTPPTNPGPFAALASRLPAPHMLLKPFVFVADTFSSLIKKL
jgi:hypothetical protein